MSEPNVWISENDLAARLGVNARTLRYWRAKKTGPTFARMGRVVRYHRDDVSAWEKVQRS